MATDTDRITTQETAGTAVLWFVVLAGPLCWSVFLVTNYMMGEIFACTPGTGYSTTIWGVGLQVWISVVTAVLGAITLGALGTAVVVHRRLSGVDRTEGRRASWMAFVGIINSIIFGLAILVGFASPILLRPCVPTP